jgi:hypothetical protein
VPIILLVLVIMCFQLVLPSQVAFGLFPLLHSSCAGRLSSAPYLPANSGGELHFCLRGEPKTFNPLLVVEDSSETIR